LSWCKVNLNCDGNDAYIIEEILVAHEAISVSMFDESAKDSIYEPKVGATPLWRSVKISALFEKKISKDFITSILKGISHKNLNINKLYHEDWIKKYQESFKPIKVGKRLWILPSWRKNEKTQGGIDLKIDPGLAFGSGTHETTQLCLEYLEKSNLKDLSVIDYGCGSGILSIASILLGAKHVFAIDNDPQAISSTTSNCILNSVEQKIKILAPGNIKDIKVDLLISNIFLFSLIDLRDEFMSSLNLDAKLVLSGIKEDQLNILTKSYKPFFSIKNVKIKNNWCLVEFQKIME